SVGEHTAWQAIPEAQNYFQIKGDSVFVNLHYKVKNRIGVIKYEGVYYNKELVEGRKQVEVKLSSTQRASDGISFELTIRNDGYITMSIVTISPKWVTISYKGELKRLE
ncbi:MAG: hypothetical protein JXR50_07935, partial [Prolixibacteraceae bacterium]|nr:hypothetical protein [Prolixibacteraceae bacterium]